MSSTKLPDVKADLDGILDRVRQVTGVQTDADLARAFNAVPGIVTNWKKRGTVPYAQAVEFARRHGLSMDWVIDGRGPMHRAEVADDTPQGYGARRPKPKPGIEDLERMREALDLVRDALGDEPEVVIDHEQSLALVDLVVRYDLDRSAVAAILRLLRGCT